MNYKVLCILILVTIYVGIFISLEAIPFTSRPDNTRINRITDHFSTGSYTTDFIIDYKYNSLTQTLIDSMITTIENNNVPQSVTKFRYTHSLEQINNRTVKDYYEYQLPENILNKHYKFITDEQGNAVETLITQSDITIVHIEFHYNSFGLADSIYYLFHPDNTDVLSYHNIFYDENNRLSNSELYSWQDNNWVPQRKIIQHYGQFPEFNIAPLDYANYRQYNLKDGFEDFTAVIDRFWCPDSISVADWDGERWVNCDNNMYIVWGNESGLNVNINDIPMGIIHNYSFNAQGLLTYFSDNMVNNLIRTYIITWENVVASEDEYQSISPVNCLITAYPNPCKSSLNIKFTGKDKAPADISIYNIKGQLIRSWKGYKATELSWDGKDSASQPVSGGMYLIRIKQANYICRTKIIKI